MRPNFLINVQGPNRFSKIIMTKIIIVLIAGLHALALSLFALKKSTSDGCSDRHFANSGSALCLAQTARI